MTRLCLVRHGETDWNLEGRYQGQSDVPLNGNGLRQARALAKSLRGLQFAALYTSDMQRASQTAAALAEQFNLVPVKDTRLREIHQGEWEGQLAVVIKKRYNELWDSRFTDPQNVRPPGGESVAEVSARVTEALDDIARAHPEENVLVVSHGLSIATAICRINSTPLSRVYEWIPDNADPIWLDWHPQEATKPPH